MKLHWKKLSVVGVAVAALAACDQRASLSPTPLGPTPVSASGQLAGPRAQTGNGAPSGQLVFSWNLIGTPGDYEGGCGEGRRIFVQRDANHEHILIQDHDDGWHIEECDATFGDTAVIHSNDLGTFNVYARILGKTNGRLTVCADLVSDHEDHLCLLGTIDLNREGGRSRFQLQPDSLFDAELEDIIWSVETNSDFRIVQFRVYQES